MSKKHYKTLNLLSYNRIKTLKFSDWLMRQHIKFELDTTGAGNVFTIFIKREVVTEEQWIINAYTDIMDAPSAPDKIGGLRAEKVIFDEWHVLPETDRVNILSSEKRKIKEEMRRNNELAALEDRIKALENRDDTHDKQIEKLQFRMNGFLELLKGRASRSTTEAMDKNLKRLNDYARYEIEDLTKRMKELEDYQIRKHNSLLTGLQEHQEHIDKQGNRLMQNSAFMHGNFQDIRDWLKQVHMLTKRLDARTTGILSKQSVNEERVRKLEESERTRHIEEGGWDD